MFAYLGLVAVAVVCFWLYAMRRVSPTSQSEQARSGNRWIVSGGLVLPVVSIIGLLLAGVPLGQRMLPLPVPGHDTLEIHITAHRWWWEVAYPGTGVVVRNEVHVPAGTPVDLHLTSQDVIHSFWVPRLGGKLDMFPGRTNVLRLEADRPGIYQGICSEYCGVGHAHMSFVVRAHAPDEFRAWLAAERTHE